MSDDVLLDAWTRYLSDEPLTALEEDALAAVLLQPSAQRRELLGDEQFDGMLTGFLRSRGDGVGFREAFVRRIAAEVDGKQFVAKVEQLLQAELAERSSPSAAPRARSGLWTLPAAAAAILALVLLLTTERSAPVRNIAAVDQPTPPAAGGMKLVRATGIVWIVSRSGETEVRAGTVLPEGCGVRLDDEAAAALSFADGTICTLSAGTSISELQDTDLAGKQAKSLRLVKGAFMAEVTAQPADLPMSILTPAAKLVVLGTVFKLRADQEHTHLEVNEGRVSLLRLSDMKSIVVEADQTGTVSAGVALAALPMAQTPSKYSFYAAAFSPDGRYLVGASNEPGREMVVFNTSSWKRERVLDGHQRGCNCVAFSPDGALLAGGGADQDLFVWDTASWTVRYRLVNVHLMGMETVSFSSDGALLASGGKDGVVRIWNAADGTEKAVLKKHKGWVWSTAFAPDGGALLSAGDDGLLCIWNVADSSLRHSITHTGFVRGAAFSADGTFIISGGREGVLRKYDVTSGRQLASWRAHESFIRGVACSLDGRFIATASEDNSTRIWNAMTQERVAYIRHTSDCSHVAFSRESRYAVSVSMDHTLKVWDLGANREVVTLRP